jgi:hypothetical protein
VVRLALLVLNVDKEFHTLCLDEIAKEEEVNYCNNCHCHIGSRSNYILCCELETVLKSTVEQGIESTKLAFWAPRYEFLLGSKAKNSNILSMYSWDIR